jgi:TRAP-type C4-dicarboxylate transport system permease small subunit
MFRKISDIAVLVGGSSLIVCAVLVTLDVFLRKIFGIVIPDADLISTYAFAIATAWAFAHVAFERANVRLDIAVNFLPRSVVIVLNFISAFALAVFSIFVLDQCANVLLESYSQGARSNTPMQVPLIIPQGAWFLGITFFSVTVLYILWRATVRIFRSDWDGINLEIGIPTIKEASNPNEIIREVAGENLEGDASK